MKVFEFKPKSEIWGIDFWNEYLQYIQYQINLIAATVFYCFSFPFYNYCIWTAISEPELKHIKFPVILHERDAKYTWFLSYVPAADRTFVHVGETGLTHWKLPLVMCYALYLSLSHTSISYDFMNFEERFRYASHEPVSPNCTSRSLVIFI